MSTLSVAIESFFFPGELDEDLTLTNVTASVELPASLGLCLARAGDQQDFVLQLYSLPQGLMGFLEARKTLQKFFEFVVWYEDEVLIQFFPACFSFSAKSHFRRSCIHP
jgi:hypothetical protein